MNRKFGRNPQAVSRVTVTELEDGRVSRFEDELAGEEPLEIRVAGRPVSVTMRTPGDDFELAAGFLFTEGLVRSRSEITGLRHSDAPGHGENAVLVDLAPGVELDEERMRRNFLATSSCGLCGKASIQAVRVRGIPAAHASLVIKPEVLWRLPEALLTAQTVFNRTGGLHAAALFDARGQLLALREDVGRHNAVDKLVGWALLQGRLPLSRCILLASGRGGFEIVQKALIAGVPVVASISAPSSLAVDLARELDLTLVGFLRGTRFVIYAGEKRIRLAGQTEMALHNS